MLIVNALLMSVYTHGAYAQATADKEKYYNFSGFVRSGLDSSALDYAHIFIEEKAIGTVSNSAGEFQLKIPASLLPVVVTISSLGYETKEVTVTDTPLLNRSFLLKPAIYMLESVTITAKKNDSSVYIFNRALKAIRFNYPRKNHLLEGFYRSTSIRDTLYTRIVEAAIRIQDGNYMRDPYSPGALEMNRARIDIVELRKTEDFRDRDWLVKVGERMFGESNELYEILATNWISSLNSNSKENHIMTKQFMLHMEMELLGSVRWENEMAYKILATYHQEKALFWYDVVLYVNKKDFAIVRIEYVNGFNDNTENLHPNLKNIGAQWLIDGKYLYRTEVNYRRVNFKYYPVFIRKTGADRDASSHAEIDGKGVRQYSDNIFLLTNVYEDDFARVKWKDTEARDQNLSHYDKPNNEAFWENYNTILLNPLGRSYEDLKQKLVKVK